MRNKSFDMRKLIMKMNVSLDDFVSGPNGEADWIFSTGDEESRASVLSIIRGSGSIIMGRKSFQVTASYWPTAPGPIAAPMNEIPKVAFTRAGFKEADMPDAKQSPASASWAGARIFDGDLAEGIRALKAEEGKPILALGGSGFMRSLINTGLIDEFHLYTAPVILGSGQPIFTDVTKPFYLKLAEVKAFPAGNVLQIYRPA